MNAVNALARDAAEQQLQEAVARASKWVDQAKPVILAYFVLEDQADEPISKALRGDPTAFECYSKRSPDALTWHDARDIVRGAATELFKMLDGIRDNFLCDERSAASPFNGSYTEADEEAYEAFDEALEREVPSVAATVKKIGDEL